MKKGTFLMVNKSGNLGTDKKLNTNCDSCSKKDSCPKLQAQETDEEQPLQPTGVVFKKREYACEPNVNKVEILKLPKGF
jgi:hypothetical protein